MAIMARPVLEIADIFRDHGSAWRQANAGHVSLGQLKVMSAIESCRTTALGGHVMRCEDCLHTQIAYNSCRNRHCPKCQGSQALAWMKQRKSELLDVPYFHVVFTLPARIRFRMKLAAAPIEWGSLSVPETMIAGFSPPWSRSTVSIRLTSRPCSSSAARNRARCARCG